jgi:glycosyltransferase involved in cell wall biosynthesis
VRDGRRWRLEEYIEHRLPGALRDGRVEWLGQRPNSELGNLRRRAAVTVVASRYETFAITICEAMAIGSPLVATLADPARAAAMGAAAAEYCCRHYAPEIVAEQTLRFYRRVLAKSATQGIPAHKESRP